MRCPAAERLLAVGRLPVCGGRLQHRHDLEVVAVRRLCVEGVGGGGRGGDGEGNLAFRCGRAATAIVIDDSSPNYPPTHTTTTHTAHTTTTHTAHTTTANTTHAATHTAANTANRR